MNDAQFGKQVAALLNEGLVRLDDQATTRLQVARSAALMHAATLPRTSPALVHAGAAAGGMGSTGGWGNWLSGPRLWLAMTVLLIGLAGITWSDWVSDRDANDGADLDLAILADDLPVTAYIDNGFDAWLKRPIEAQP